jgi:hypothetical protein
MSTDNDIVPRMRLWAEGLQNQKDVVLAVAITEAADEIERLRAERDEARREVCESDADTHGGALLEAERRGWDCFDLENGNA